MPALRTEAQREASRANGRKSRGPVSEAGKAQSRRNGLLDGLFSSTVLPDDLDDELDAEIAVFATRFRPRDAYETRLVETAALAQLKLARLQRAELLADNRRVRNAVRDWDDARADEIDALTDLLDSDPAEAVRALRRTAEGCDRLADLWHALSDTLEASGGWSPEENRQALALIGLIRPPHLHREPNAAAFYRNAWALTVRDEPEAPDPQTQDRPVEPLLANLPPRDEALAAVLAFVAEEIAALMTLGDSLWEQFDKPDRAAAPALALFDTSDDGRRLRRALAQTERLQRRALAELAKHRADDHDAPHQPQPQKASAPPLTAPAQSEPEPAPPPARRAPSPAQSEPEPIPSSTPRTRPALDLDPVATTVLPLWITPTKHS